MQTSEMGFFGNIWLRQNTMPTKGMVFAGHKHKFDHVTMLVKGSIKVEVEGCDPTEYVAPTFVIIRKEYIHRITALVDDTAFYCVFAVRDLDGEPIEDMAHEKVDPMFNSAVPKDYWIARDEITAEAARAPISQ
jgi:hypothetical protein